MSELAGWLTEWQANNMRQKHNNNKHFKDIFYGGLQVVQRCCYFGRTHHSTQNKHDFIFCNSTIAVRSSSLLNRYSDKAVLYKKLLIDGRPNREGGLGRTETKY